MRVLLRTIAVLSLFSVWSTALGAVPEADALLVRMRQAYHSIHSAKWSIVSKIGGRRSKCDLEFAGAGIRAVYGPSGGTGAVTLLWSDGKNLFHRSGHGTPVLEIPFVLESFERAIPGDLESVCFFDADRQLSTTRGGNMSGSALSVGSTEWAERHWILLEEKAPRERIVCHYYVDPNTYLIWRTTVQEDGQTEVAYDIRITALATNVSLPPSDFTPGGSAIHLDGLFRKIVKV